MRRVGQVTAGVAAGGGRAAHQTGLSTSVFNAGQAVPMKFQLRNAAGQLVQAGSYWRVGVALDDGQTYYVNVGLR